MATVGTIIGSYSLDGILGSSGLATVYSAVDTSSGHRVALKVLHSYFSEERALVQRFFEELERIKALDHQNILPLVAWGRDNGVIWMATQYAPEGSLRTTWQGPGTLSDTQVIVADVAAALEYALARGMTHRDLKPSNVFWDAKSGTARLGDFGMAQLAEGTHLLMRTALTTPMPAFMAPEYAGEGQSDARSETFSLAVLAYWLLTGTVPYNADSPSTMYAKAMRHDLIPPSIINPAVPPAVDKLILRALAPFPAVRPPSPAAFAEALLDTTGSTSASLKALPASQKAQASPSPVASLIGSLAEVAAESPLIAELAKFPLLERFWGKQKYRPTVRERIVQGALLLSFVAATVLGYAAWMRPPEIAPTTALTAEVAPDQWALTRHDLTNSAHAPLSTAGIAGQLKWKFQTTASFTSSPTSDGKTVYATTGEGRVLALDAETGAIRWQAATTGPMDASPVVAGDFVYVGLRDYRIIALDRATGQLRWEFSTGNPVFASAVVSDGVLYQGSGDGKLYALDAATGALLWKFDGGSWIAAPPSVVDGMVVVAITDGWIHFLDRANGQERFLFDTAGTLSTTAAIMQGRVFMASEAQRLFAVDIHERSTFMDRQIYWVRVLLWWWKMAPPPPPPKGLIWAARLTGRVATSAAIAHNLVYVGSDNGKLLAFEVETGKKVWELALPAPVLGGPVVTSDVLYAGSDDGKLYAIDPVTGKQLWSFQTGGKLRTTPAVAGGSLFVTSEDGAIYALH